MHRLTDTVLALALAGVGTGLVGMSAIVAAVGARQAVRAAPLPLHPWGAAAGLIALPGGLACLYAARRRLDAITADRFRAWEMRQA